MGDPSERLGLESESAMESSMNEELFMEIDSPFIENLATAEDWRKALNKVVPAVVVLRTTACRAFDTESAGSSYATGFVVDKRRGIILTNRHVVKPGPVVAEAMFVNCEEIPVYPIYRDPALVKKDPARHQVLHVKGCLAGSKAENLLEQDDMVLAINKEPITCSRDIEDACQALDQCADNGRLNMTIFRQGRDIELHVETDVRNGNGTTRVINWCGSIVQDPHPPVRALGFLPEEGHGVYVARWCHGSPVHRYGLYALQWIVEVNGKPTPNLDAFVDVTKGLEHGEFVRVRTVHLNGKPRVLTLKQDLHYWPTWELKLDTETAMWRWKMIKALDCGIV